MIQMPMPAYATTPERAWYYAHRVIVAAILLFLIAPILVIMPLSFNSEPYFSYPMPGLSLRWYEDFFTNDRWTLALQNSIIVAVSVTLVSTALGTLAALGLSRPRFPARGLIMSLLISPIVVPVIISAVGMYFFYTRVGLTNSIPGVVLAHTALATPFVVITVTATLSGFDQTLTRAAASLGSNPVHSFFKITLPLILPGVISGGLFAFVTSFDEVVVVLFIASPEQRTLPKQMFSGIREMISPTITAAATLLILFAVAMLTTVELLRRRSERLRGIRS
ncbi:polyamine ABC transporter permease [Hypericibacter adhaerens]|uniref:Polyamine ABC transporter permease n=2 Tax=Hypericibacter adhaerens TaxID=2602016 RepID=A0A5J6N270_9PROT|nr:polyamine ABC transporter permease [Hypericibacter adhaerens]